MSKTTKAEYTGTWIPAHIMEDELLTSSSKILYALIASFNTCFASNKWLAAKLGVTVRQTQRCITELEDKGYVARSGEEDNRVLVALRDDPRHPRHGGDDINVMGGMTSMSPNNKVKAKAEKAPQETPDSFDENMSPQAGELPPTPTCPPTTNKLHYDVIKKYALPVSNHLHVKSKSKAFDDEIGADAAQAYLQRLLDVDYQALVGDFKPELNHSRDIYNKRIQINKFIDEHIPYPVAAMSGKTALEIADEASQKREWGF